MNFNKEELRHVIPTAAYKRGNEYWLEGCIKKLQLQAQKNGRLLIISHVQGLNKTQYKQRIVLSRDKLGVLELEAECNCSVGYRCKHVAAALLEIIENRRNPSNATEAESAKNRVDKVKKQALPLDFHSDLAPDLQHWLHNLKHSIQTPEPNTYPDNLHQRLVYILHLHNRTQILNPLLQETTPTFASQSVAVELVSTRLLKRGGYSVSYPYRGGDAAYIRPIDRYILKLLNVNNNLYSSTTPAPEMYPLQGEEARDILLKLLQTERCHWQDKSSPALHLGEPQSAKATWQVEQDGSQRLQYQLESAVDTILPLSPPWYLNAKTGLCGILETGLPDQLAGILLNAPPLQPNEVDSVCKALEQQRLQTPHVDLPQPKPLNTARKEKRKPVCHLHLFNTQCEPLTEHAGDYNNETQTIPLLRLSFIYGNLKIPAYPEETLLHTHYAQYGEDVVELERDLTAEAEAKTLLETLNFSPLEQQIWAKHFKLSPIHQFDLMLNCQEWPLSHSMEQALLEFNLNKINDLRDQGWQINIDPDYLYRTVAPESINEWYAEIEESSGIDWFGLELGVHIDGEQVNLLPLIVDLLRNMRHLNELHLLQELPDDSLLIPRLADGRILPLEMGRMRHIINILVELFDNQPLDENSRLRMLTLRAAQLVELETAMNTAQMRWLGGERLLQLGRKLRDFNGIQVQPVPDNFQTELRPYQQEGLNWLQFLREYNLSGILADDMGLGKTVQTLAHILIEKNTGRLTKPCLVIAPTSLMVNWRMEAHKFAPSLNILVLHGPDRKANFKHINQHDIVLTTYPLLPRDKDILLETQYHLLILDEAQNIKNPKAKVTQLVHQIKAKHRLCLTGTPMENHLGELWSLFHFLMPGLLGDQQSFRQLFRGPIERDADVSRRNILANRIAPFMIRRTKEEVVKELPEKNEIIRTVELEGKQRDLYETIRLTMHNKVRKEIAEKGVARSQIIILDALLKLRQICCDPRLLKLNSTTAVAESAKLNLLMDLVPEMVEEGRKILLFSQFTSMLALIEEALKERDVGYVKLTGQTKNRGEVVEQFQTTDVPVFLISLKAGGTGLNLTAADTVIHYDPWWNPAVEEQATDRAHRIGQEKRVFVYKLLTASTVEEKIQDLQIRKQQLADALFKGEAMNGSLSAADLDMLFGPLD